jgi:hypothetical protein
MRRHCSAVGIGERNLALSRPVQFRQHVLVPLAPLPDRGDLLGQVLDPKSPHRFAQTAKRVSIGGEV